MSVAGVSLPTQVRASRGIFTLRIPRHAPEQRAPPAPASGYAPISGAEHRVHEQFALFILTAQSPGTRYARSSLHSVVVSQVVASDTSSPGCGLAVELHIAAMQCLQARPVVFSMLLNSAACCNPVQYVATQCSMLQQRATCCNALARKCASSRMHAGCDV